MALVKRVDRLVGMNDVDGVRPDDPPQFRGVERIKRQFPFEVKQWPSAVSKLRQQRAVARGDHDLHIECGGVAANVEHECLGAAAINAIQNMENFHQNR